jgi:hypothetical protein
MRNNQKSLSNGCLMRISPLGIVGTKWDLENLQRAAKMDCTLTNPNPDTLEAVSVYVTAIQTAIRTGDPVETYAAAMAATSENGLVQKILIMAVQQAEPIVLSNGQAIMTDSQQFQGYFGVALQNTFYELLNTDGFEQSMMNILSRGGDTDTNCAIAGALLGAVYGFHAIPLDWWETVLSAPTETRQQQYPEVETADLIDLALFLLDKKNHILEPNFKTEPCEIHDEVKDATTISDEVKTATSDEVKDETSDEVKTTTSDECYETSDENYEVDDDDEDEDLTQK